MSAKLNYPAHLEIARKGTPLQKMERLSEELGVEIFFKRDDLTGCELSGNKIRKNRSVFGNRIVFVHTGGLFGLFPVADKFEELF